MLDTKQELLVEQEQYAHQLRQQQQRHFAAAIQQSNSTLDSGHPVSRPLSIASSHLSSIPTPPSRSAHDTRIPRLIAHDSNPHLTLQALRRGLEQLGALVLQLGEQQKSQEDKIDQLRASSEASTEAGTGAVKRLERRIAQLETEAQSSSNLLQHLQTSTQGNSGRDRFKDEILARIAALEGSEQASTFFISSVQNLPFPPGNRSKGHQRRHRQRQEQPPSFSSSDGNVGPRDGRAEVVEEQRTAAPSMRLFALHWNETTKRPEAKVMGSENDELLGGRFLAGACRISTEDVLLTGGLHSLHGLPTPLAKLWNCVTGTEL